MSRLAKKPLMIPEGVQVSVVGSLVTVKGTKGTLSRTLHPSVQVVVEGREVRVSLLGTNQKLRPHVGTSVAHIKNMIAGVATPFEKKLVVEGIGFKAEVKGATLVLALGFTHPVSFAIPVWLSVKVEKNSISIIGPDVEEVGQFAACVRAARKPEPYKGKGIRYETEVIRRKQGKKTV